MANHVLGCKKVERHILPHNVSSILDFLNNARQFPEQVQEIDALQESSHDGAHTAPTWLFINCSLTNLLSPYCWHRIQEQIKRNHAVLFTLNLHSADGKTYNILSLYPLAWIEEGHVTFVKLVPAPDTTLAVVQAGLYQFLPVVSYYHPLYSVKGVAK